MKVKLVTYLFCMGAVLAAGHAAAQSSCSDGVFKGNYIFDDRGVLATALWYASAGNLVANGDGTGQIVRETTSTAGVIAPKSTSITYSVIAGAGTSTSCGFAVATGDGRNFDLYLSSSGKSGYFLATSGVVSVGLTTVGITGIEGEIKQP